MTEVVEVVESSVVDAGLSLLDEGLWKSLRAKVKKNWTQVQTFFEHLKEIRDKRLYRGEYKTFEAYIESELKIGRSWTYQGISDLETRQEIIEIAPQIPKKEVEDMPTRMLAKIRKVPQDQRVEVFAKATDLSTDGKDIVEHIDEAIKEVCGEIATKPYRPPEVKPVAASDQGNMGDFAEKPVVEPIESKPPVEVIAVDTSAITVVDTSAALLKMFDAFNDNVKAAKLLYERSNAAERAMAAMIFDDKSVEELTPPQVFGKIMELSTLLDSEYRTKLADAMGVQEGFDIPSSNRLFAATPQEQVEDIVDKIGPNATAEAVFNKCETLKAQDELVKHVEKLAAERKKKPSLYSESFEKFWNAYPSVRKKDKKGAFDSWTKALKELNTVDCPHEEGDWESYLVRRAGDYANSWQGNNQYSRGPAPWLNQSGWDDSDESWAIPADERAKLDPGANYENGRKVSNNWDSVGVN